MPDLPEQTVNDILGWIDRNPLYEPSRAEVDVLVAEIKWLREQNR